MARYQRPNVSRLTRASAVAAAQSRVLRGGPMSSSPRVRVLGQYSEPTLSYDYANATGEDTVLKTASGGTEYYNASTGVTSYSGGGSGSATSIFSAIGNIFGSKSAATGYSYMPTTSNTSTYLLIGGAVLGGILLITLLR
jgi:hypothetical protein